MPDAGSLYMYAINEKHRIAKLHTQDIFITFSM
jgi:hypothetical protein